MLSNSGSDDGFDSFVVDEQVLVQELLTLIEPFSFNLSHDQAELLVKHLLLVLQANQKMNLTRITSLHNGLILHILDSLLFVPVINSLSLPAHASFLDIGTGAGYPGIPLSIATDLSGVLIDSVGKKVKADSYFIDSLGLFDRLSALHTRAEDLAREQGQSFDVVVARAVAQTSVLLEYASPLLKNKSYLVVSKGNLMGEEFDHAKKLSCRLGFSYVSRETFELPEGSGHRELLVFKKTGKSSIKLPRQNGMATRRPL